MNPQTGSALISYECDRKALVEFARENGVFLEAVPPRQKSLFGNVADTFQAYNKDLRN